MQAFSFKAAVPVWAKGRETEMNVSIQLRAVVPQTPAVLHIAGHSCYQIFVNGTFFAQGPARAGHGCFRADVLDLTPRLENKQNIVCILCAGYNANSYYLTDQPSFVCAEILAGEEILFATGTDKPFDAAAFDERERFVQRFSFQRPFTESYHFSRTFDRFRTDADAPFDPIPMERTAPKRFLTRETLRSDYEPRGAKTLLARGTIAPAAEKRRFADRSLTRAGSGPLKGFPENELTLSAVNTLYGYSFRITDKTPSPAAPLPLGADSFALYDMGVNTSGYLRLTLTPQKDAVVWAVFNEKLPPTGVPDPGRDGCACVVCWALEGGRRYDLLSFEPYTYRFLQIIIQNAPVEIGDVAQLCEHYPAAGLLPPPALQDEALQKIYDAAVETFRQNATDIFMDCPSRERAGWLCDSFFTARTEYALTGESRIETAFLENFLMEERFDTLPDGMLPMCYPADHPDGIYIPNWAMWYLLELAEYKTRSGNTALIESAKEKMYALASFLRGFENEDGLLEKLKSWVFIEWSLANKFTQDVNYPTNMLYALFLETLGTLYDDPALLEQAQARKETIRRQAFDGTYFIDNAVRENGVLTPTTNHTETAQYYAFFTGVATPESHPALYRLLMERFGPARDPEKDFPDVPVANAFIGNYLRLELLFRDGAYTQLCDEIRAFFLPMAESTGTLWENMQDNASCCHGFASHVACWLRAVGTRRASTASDTSAD